MNRTLPRARNNGQPSAHESAAALLEGAKHYGSRELAKEVYSLAEAPLLTPLINRDYLRATAATRGASGEPEVRENAGNHFDLTNAKAEAECRRLKTEVEGGLNGANRHVQELSGLLEQTPRYNEEPRAGVPWTKPDRVQVGFFAVVAVVLLAVGINTNAVVLISSGIAGFEQPLRA